MSDRYSGDSKVPATFHGGDTERTGQETCGQFLGYDAQEECTCIRREGHPGMHACEHLVDAS